MGGHMVCIPEQTMVKYRVFAMFAMLNKSPKLGQAAHFITQIADKVLHPLITSHYRG